jgi:adenylosuccinate synthase
MNEGKTDLLLGLQWGDEGKGKLVDVIVPGYDIIARFQGGPNAGHSLEFDGIKHVLHTIPSGIFHDHVINLIGNGVIIDPWLFRGECLELKEKGVPIENRLVISRKAHLILPTHVFLDRSSEDSKGKEKIGSTGRGIGPTYIDKTGRNGLRVGDIFSSKFKEKYEKLKDKHLGLLKDYLTNSKNLIEFEQMENNFFAGVEFMKTLKMVDGEYFINQALEDGKKVLAEGAQGSLLDVDFGTYPFVTSSNTISGGACIGLGVSPNKVNNIFGVFKAYCTRVGFGPFPTKLTNEVGELIQKKGKEKGSTTGRPRDCGWLDLPALKYAIMINGVTGLIMMKADVLSSDFETIKICTHYKINGIETDQIPFDIVDADIEPVYKDFVAWGDIRNVKAYNEFPVSFRNYVEFIEKEVGKSIKIISIGPDRKDTIVR